MNSIWFFDDVNLFKVLCPHKFKAYKADHDYDTYKKKDYIYFEEDSANKVYLIEKGKVKIRADKYICPNCSYSELKEEHEPKLKVSIQYTCPHCDNVGEAETEFKRKTWQ